MECYHLTTCGLRVSHGFVELPGEEIAATWLVAAEKDAECGVVVELWIVRGDTDACTMRDLGPPKRIPDAWYVGCRT